MNQLGIIASSISKAVASAFIFTTTSVSAAWSPWKVTNAGSTLTWDATGAVTDTQVANDPTFDFSSGGGGDIDLSVTDVVQVTALWLFALNLKTIDCTTLNSNITDLRIDRNQITTVDVTTLTSLITLHLYSNTSLANTDFSNNTALTDLRVDGCNMTTLDVSASTSLSTLRCYNNSIPLAGLTLPTSLTLLYMNGNPIAGAFNASTLTSLTSFNCYSCQLTGLTLGGGAITNLSCYSNASLTTLDVSSETNMTSLTAFGCGLTNGITTLVASSLLKTVWVYQNSFTATATNALLADLVASGVINGTLKYRNNETGQGVTDRAQLVTDGWTITNYAT